METTFLNQDLKTKFTDICKMKGDIKSRSRKLLEVRRGKGQSHFDICHFHRSTTKEVRS